MADQNNNQNNNPRPPTNAGIGNGGAAGNGNGTNVRRLKIFMVIMLTLLSVFLLSFNVTMVYILEGRRAQVQEIKERKSSGKQSDGGSGIGKTMGDNVPWHKRKQAWKNKREKRIEQAMALEQEIRNDVQKELEKQLEELEQEIHHERDEKTIDRLNYEIQLLRQQLEEEKNIAKEEEERQVYDEEYEEKEEREEVLINFYDEPVFGQYRTTVRPLDGFNDSSESSGKMRPTVQSFSRQRNSHSAPDPSSRFGGDVFLNSTTSQQSPETASASSSTSTPNFGTTASAAGSTVLTADAHFAKALRMLSSDFDRLEGGGNALPAEVFQGSYDQSIHESNLHSGKFLSGASRGNDGIGRGDGFVKMNIASKNKGFGSGHKKGRAGSQGSDKSKKRKGRSSRNKRASRENGYERDVREKKALLVVLLNAYSNLFFNVVDFVSEFVSKFIEDFPVFGKTYYFFERIFDGVYDLGEMALDWVVDRLESFGLEINFNRKNRSGASTKITQSTDSSKESGNEQDDYKLYHYPNEEDFFSWKDTRVGSQLIWITGKVASLWSRKTSSSISGTSTSSKKSSSRSTSPSSATTSFAGSDSSVDGSSGQSKFVLSESDEIARLGLYHLEKAAELGHSEAQRMVANSLASGILPLNDHSLLRRIELSEMGNSAFKNHTLIQSQRLRVPSDFSSGGQQLSKAIILWHLSAMDGNAEAAMALGYRHFYSATGGLSASISDLSDSSHSIAMGYKDSSSSSNGIHGTTVTSHYGVLGTCPTALAYYEAAANSIMDYLESSPSKGKVNPPLDEHRLAEIYMHGGGGRGGGSLALESHNKPDELEEALQYYRMLASRNRTPEPDLMAAFTIANFYYYGLRGVKQDLRLALKYYEICGDYGHVEGGGQAGLMHVWGIGMDVATGQERDLGKAFWYFIRGTFGGDLEGCANREKRRRKKRSKEGNPEEEKTCDRHCLNGMGYIHLFGIEGLVERNVGLAKRWFELAKDVGDPDAQYNYAMLRLGWMVSEPDYATASSAGSKGSSTGESSAVKYDLPYTTRHLSYMSHRRYAAETQPSDYTGPSTSDFNVAVQELTRASSKGHLQAKHKLAMLYATGIEIPQTTSGKNSSGRTSIVKTTKAVGQSCTSALKLFKSIADNSHIISHRNRAAWKQYNNGEYESSLRNYLASAELGSEVGMVNAAFLLERGHCLGLDRMDMLDAIEEKDEISSARVRKNEGADAGGSACSRASVRLWRAAARHGNLEASLRVGDFYYYGRMKSRKPMKKTSLQVTESGDKRFLYDEEEDDFFSRSSWEGKALYFAPGPYRWARYLLFPEELVPLAKKWFDDKVKSFMTKLSSTSTAELEESNVKPEPEVCSKQEEEGGTCQPEWANDDNGENDSEGESKDEENNHMAIAAQYYRKAAEEHNSARAHFNLAFMHEWGLGLAQDFPLAKRHYDLASEEADLAATLALYAMNVHETFVRLQMKYFKSSATITPSDPSGIIYQADDSRNRLEDVEIDTTHGGYTSEGYADFGEIGSYVEWPQVAGGKGDREQPCTLLFRYASSGSRVPRPCDVKINGISQGRIQFESSGHSWSDWDVAKIEATCRPGINVVRLTAVTDNGGPNIDYLEISFPEYNDSNKRKEIERTKRELSRSNQKKNEKINFQKKTLDSSSSSNLNVKKSLDDKTKNSVSNSINTNAQKSPKNVDGPSLKTFPDNFETGDFSGLPWTNHEGQWQVLPTPSNPSPPFSSTYSAVATTSDLDQGECAKLGINMHSPGGKFCMYLYASVAMPWETFDLVLDDHVEYTFTAPTNRRKKESWVDVCFEIPKHHHNLGFHLCKSNVELNDEQKVNKSSKGVVMINNVRFNPYPDEDFESGDFSKFKGTFSGYGAPWDIASDQAHGKYAARARPTKDQPKGTSELNMKVDFGNDGAYVEFQVMAHIQNVGLDDCLWFMMDGNRIRPFGMDEDKEWQKYKHYIPKGVHTLTWSFRSSGKDAEATVWLDSIVFKPKDSQKFMVPSVNAIHSNSADTR